MSEGSSPPSFEHPGWNKWEVLIVVMVGTFMAILDSSIVNIALPHIMTSLGVVLSDAEWVLTAFMLAAAVSMPLTGWLGQRIGYGRLYLVMLVIFTIGSAMSGLSWDINSLIVARVVQAVGAGMMQPTGMAMLTQVFEPHERGRAIGIWGIGAMVAPTIGPTAGGYLTDWFGWRSIFTINIPVGILLFLMGARVFAAKENHPRPPAFDWVGYLALSVFLICLLLGLDKGQDHGWTSAPILAYFAVAGIGFITFLTAEWGADNAVIPLGMFKSADFSIGLLIALIRAVALFGAVFLLPVFLQNLQGRTVVQTGIILVPAAVTIAVFMPISGSITDRFGARWPTVAGVALTAVSLYMYRTLDVDSGVWDIVYPQFFRGAGIALMMTPVATAAFNAVPQRQAGIASGLLNVGQRAGGSFGIALLSTILARRTVMHAELIGASDMVNRGLGEAARLAMAALPTEQAHAAAVYVMARAAEVRAFDDAFVLAAGITMLGLVPAFFLSARPPEKPS